MFRLVQWKEVFQKRHAHNQNPKSTIVIIIIIVVVMQHKQIVPNPHKHHYHQHPGWVNCVTPQIVILKAPRAETVDLVLPKALLFLEMCIWCLGKCILCVWILLDGAHWLSADGMKPKVTISEVNRSHHQCSQNYVKIMSTSITRFHWEPKMG